MTERPLQGTLAGRLLPSVLADIAGRQLAGRLVLEKDGATVLDLSVGGGRGRTAAGDVEEAVRHAVALSDARYRLLPGEAPADGVSLSRLALLAARAVADIERIREALGNLDAPLALTAAGKQGGPGLGLDPQEGFLLSRVDGHGGARAICQMSPAGEEDTLRMLYALRSAGLLQAAAAATPVQEVKKVEDPLSKLEGFLQRTEGSAAGTRSAGPAPAGGAQAAQPQAAAAPAVPPSPEAGPAAREPVQVRDAERQRLERRLETGARENHYEILGLRDDASPDEIRKTYFILARQFHPDKFHRPNVRDLQPALEKLFARMTEAYQTLSDGETRRDYDTRLRGGGTDSKAVQEKAAKEVARDNYRHARSLMAKGQLVKALSYLENAVKADPTQADHLEALGSLEALNPRVKAEAEVHLQKAIQLAPSRANAYLMLGLFYARYGRTREAAKFLRQAIAWDSSCEPARVILGQLDGEPKQAADGATALIKKLVREA